MQQWDAIGKLCDCRGCCLPDERVDQRVLGNTWTWYGHVFASLGIYLDVVQIRDVCKYMRNK